MQEKSNAELIRERVVARYEENVESGLIRPPGEPVLAVTQLTVNGVPRTTMDELARLAFKSGTSASALALLAVEQLLKRARASDALARSSTSERQSN